MTTSQKRELIRRGHDLRATLVIGRAGLTPAVVEDVRHAMTRRDLLKIRIDAESGPAATQIAAQLAQDIGAQLVQRVGRVALVYRPLAQTDSPE